MILRQFSKMLSEIRYDAMPQEVKNKVSQCCRDMVGVFLGGKKLREAEIVHRSLVGPDGAITDPALLALWIGSVTRLIDLDDGHMRAMGHPGCPVWAAAFATAAMYGAEGKVFAEAAVRGYEIYCHLGRAVNPKAYLERGFDSTGTCGAVAAAVVAGTILGIEEEKQAGAVSIAASLCGGLNQYSIDGGSPKYLCAGWAAMLGLQAVRLALCGADGPAMIFEGKKGFCHAFAGEYDHALLEDMTVRWDVLDIYLKRFACVRRLHAALDIVDEIVIRQSLDLGSIENIDVAGSYFIAESAVFRPKNFVQAQTSMPYTIALLLKYGKITQEIVKNNLEDVGIHALADKVRVREKESFNEALTRRGDLWGSAEVTVRMKSGESHAKMLEYALGERKNPLPDKILKDKFLALAQDGEDDAFAKDMFEALADLSQICDMREVASRLIK